MPRRALELLETQLDEAYRMQRARLDGLTDEEFAWEPAAFWHGGEIGALRDLYRINAGGT